MHYPTFGNLQDKFLNSIISREYTWGVRKTKFAESLICCARPGSPFQLLGSRFGSLLWNHFSFPIRPPDKIVKSQIITVYNSFSKMFRENKVCSGFGVRTQHSLLDRLHKFFYIFFLKVHVKISLMWRSHGSKFFCKQYFSKFYLSKNFFLKESKHKNGKNWYKSIQIYTIFCKIHVSTPSKIFFCWKKFFFAYVWT
jgi:hypothetical protein